MGTKVTSGSANTDPFHAGVVYIQGQVGQILDAASTAFLFLMVAAVICWVFERFFPNKVCRWLFQFPAMFFGIIAGAIAVSGMGFALAVGTMIDYYNSVPHASTATADDKLVGEAVVWGLVVLAVYSAVVFAVLLLIKKYFGKRLGGWLGKFKPHPIRYIKRKLEW